MAAAKICKHFSSMAANSPHIWNGFLGLVLALEVLSCSAASAQTPSGAVAGFITDPNGAVIVNGQISLTSTATGFNRIIKISPQGAFIFAGLQPGTYTIIAEAQGFQRITQNVVVEAGRTSTLDLAMKIGTADAQLVVTAASPQIRYDAHEISAVITRNEIEVLPLNGRSVLELAKLEPGAQQPSYASNNRTFVPLLGAPIGQNGRATRVTVDGGSIMQVGNGGSAMGFSQELVQEFQVSTANFDLSTGVTGSGAVNVITRSGRNQLHGAGFMFFRDHTLSAFPGLVRSTFHQDPFFQRRQFGFMVGGPIKRDQMFFFGSFERGEQRGALATQILTPEFAALSRITASPRYVNQGSGRTDLQLTNKHLLFIRQSHEGVSTFSTTNANAAARPYPSAWTRQPSWADQSIFGVTSQLSSNVVNDLRFSYFFVSSSETASKVEDCTDCLGMGAPAIIVNPDLFIGNSNAAVVLGRRFHLHDVTSWQKGVHRLRFGGDLELARGGRTDTNNQPVTMTLYSPSQVRAFNQLASTLPEMRIPLPATFTTFEDILQLPVQSFVVGVGDPKLPEKYSPLVHLFLQDTWRAHPRFTLNYGLGWTFDAPLNYDLAKPAYLAPFFGEQRLGRRSKNWNNFSPSAGFALSPGLEGKTVIRGGAGIYYDFQIPVGFPDSERLALSPRGTGRGIYRSSAIRSPIGLPGMPIGTPLSSLSRSPSFFTGAILLQSLGTIRAGLEQQRGDPNNPDFSVTNIEADKQGNLLDHEFPSPKAVHFGVGMQHELAQQLVVTVDFVYRRFSPLGANVDRNHFFSSDGPVLPVCTIPQRTDPKAQCSLGPINVVTPMGMARYQGLLVRVERKSSSSLQFVGSYAYSSNAGHSLTNGLGSDAPLDPLDRDVPHVVNISATAQLPLRFQVGTVVTYYSKPAFSALLGGLDLNGDGETGDLLPGSTPNGFNRRMGKHDLLRLVMNFNQKYAGGKDAFGRPIPAILLPAHFEFGDSLFTQDIRLSRTFKLGERGRVTLIGEVFNLFNVGNLSGYSNDLLAPGFGQPTSRVTQVFGSGGPRSIQLAARVEF
jgi:hypothetical protein